MEKFHSNNPRDDVEVVTLRRTFTYDPETGVLRKNGRRVGWLHKTTGYRYVSFGGHEYKEHRIAWAIHFGEWPIGQIDHRNRKRADNRITNLRDVGGSENQWNIGVRKDNSSGFPGVSFHIGSKKYIARIRLNGKRVHLGYFSTAEEAAEAYEQAKRTRPG